jgi:hypothetical protein
MIRNVVLSVVIPSVVMLFVVVLSDIMLIVVVLSEVMLSVIMLSVVAPSEYLFRLLPSWQVVYLRVKPTLEIFCW